MIISIYLDQNLKTPLDYAVPKELQKHVRVGSRVEVPLKTQKAQGTVAAIKTTSSFANLRAILNVLSEKGSLSDTRFALAKWMAEYYATPLQKVLKCFVPPHVRKNTERQKKAWIQLAKTQEESMQHAALLRGKAAKQAEVLDLLLSFPKGMFLSDLLAQKISKSAIDALKKTQWIKSSWVEENDDFLMDEEFFPSTAKTLNAEQKNALQILEKAIESAQFSAHLLHGITGSGKTEIYLQAIEKTLSLGKSAMVLVPEIALTSQTIERFRSRFSQKLAILHHKKSLGERSSAWRDLQAGKIQIVIGARSAVFCPIQNLGLIIVDEEHDGSYKQSEEAPCYQGRDVAVMRAHFEKCVALLGSATPSLESFYNAHIGKYALHTLNHRATKASLPSWQIVDMNTAFERNGGFTHFSQELLEAIKERLQKGEQTLLLLNRRGYHRMQLCSACKTAVKCPHCDLSLTYHREENCLKCHICNHHLPPSKNCPHCHAVGSFEFKGFGTEHVERSLHAIFPGIRSIRMDRDTTQKKHSHEELFQQFRSHKADVLIGTQMIAKGLHFPSVTLVGVLNLDSSLNIPDFRSKEHLFQLMTQVAGRAGRADLPGVVILQTFLPEHPMMQMGISQNYQEFYRQEIEDRKLFGYPPFSHLIKILLSSLDEKHALQLAEHIHKELVQEFASSLHVFPVVPAGHPKIKNAYRFQFLIKTHKVRPVTAYLERFSYPELKIDVDPLSTFF